MKNTGLYLVILTEISNCPFCTETFAYMVACCMNWAITPIKEGSKLEFGVLENGLAPDEQELEHVKQCMTN